MEARPSFEKVAKYYDMLTNILSVGYIIKSQQALLHLIPPHMKVLMVGGGTGDFLLDILKRAPKKIVYLELSESMIAIARQKLIEQAPEHLPIVSFRCGSTEALLPRDSFDLIVTNYLFDLYTDKHASILLEKLTYVHKMNGILLYTDFSDDERHWVLKRLNKTILNLLYRFFRNFSEYKNK